MSVHGNTNGVSTGTTAARTGPISLPGQLNRYARKARRFRIVLEDAVTATHGEIGPGRAVTIHAVCCHFLLSMLWFRQIRDGLPVDQLALISDRASRELDKMDVSINRLKLTTAAKDTVAGFYSGQRAAMDAASEPVEA